MTQQYVDMGIMVDEAGNEYFTHLGMGDHGYGPQTLTELRDENGNAYYVDNNGARATPYNGDTIQTGDGSYVLSGGQERPARASSAFSVIDGKPAPPDAKLRFVGMRPMLAEVPENSFNPIGFAARALTEPGMGLLLAGLGGNLIGAAGGAGGAAAAEPAAAGWVTGAGESLGGGLGSGMGLGAAGAAGAVGASVPAWAPATQAGVTFSTEMGLGPALMEAATMASTGLTAAEMVALGVPQAIATMAEMGIAGPVADAIRGTASATNAISNVGSAGSGGVMDTIGDIFGGNIPSWLLPALGAIGGAVSTPESGIEMELPWNYQDLQRLSGEAWDVYGRTNTPSADEMAWYDQYMGSLGGAQNAVNTGLSRADQDYYDTYRPSDQMMGLYDQYIDSLGGAQNAVNAGLSRADQDYYDTYRPSDQMMGLYDQYIDSLGGAQNAVNAGLSRADQDYYDTYRPSDAMMSWYDDYMGGLGNSMGELNKTLAGDYLTPDNPLYKSIFDDVTSRMGSMFYSTDMTGPMQSRSAFAPTYSKEMSGQLAANLFNPERNRMMQAANMMPGLGTAGMNATDFMENYGTRATDRYNQQVSGLAPLTPMLGAAGMGATDFMENYGTRATDRYNQQVSGLAPLTPVLGTAGMGATDFMENYGTRATDRYNQQVKGLAPLTPVLGEAGQRASNFMSQYPWQAFGNLANTIKPYGQVSPYPGGNTAANALGGLFGGLAMNNFLKPKG